MSQMSAIANRSRMVNGVPMSLCDLGYCDVGLDDNWQECGSYGPNKYSFHDVNGRPVVNQQRFPDFIAMTDYAHSLGLTAGWYGERLKRKTLRHSARAKLTKCRTYTPNRK
jgi:hypothetical protein